MADVWKSQGRKFCEICKVWFGDNRASIEHHERGKKHKDALAMKLRELGKKSREKEKMAAKMSSALAAMEHAALKSMKEHGESLEHGPALPASKIFDPKKFTDINSMAREMAKRKQDALNKTVPSMSKRDAKYEPVAKIAKNGNNDTKSLLNIESSYFNDYVVEKEKEETSSEIVWVEASCDDNSGRKYYWNIYTGESMWNPPPSFYTACEYQIRLAAEDVCAQNASLFSGESSTNVQVKQEPDREKAIMHLNQEEYYQGNTYTTVPEYIHLPCEIPLPREYSGIGSEKVPVVKNELLEQNISVPPDEPALRDRELLEQNISVPPDEPALRDRELLEQNISVPPDEPALRDQFCEYSENKEERDTGDIKEHKPSAGPLGEWIRVKKEERKEPVFSPITAKFREHEARMKKELEKKAKLEPKVNFEEKTTVTMTKKVKGPIEFKKKSVAKNIRKRDS